ncbi:unnamed protein product [Dracunculus medinensis]|uniref:NADH dehydrogenase [ubiquinone] 1 beta subcomplex subunit 11, mitochondrial n=1 Tax=Dracunculus medinensis TaxID=318479 RepID=A0A0N4U551_DRAME|nr:unnamed protein product [Dracunculus medinensis]
MLRILPSVNCRTTYIVNCLSYSSDAAHKNSGDEQIERQAVDYRPGSDSYAYENPWPKLNRGRLDWLFGDGWRRPLAKDQGAKMRREWIWFNRVAHDEYEDWKRYHSFMFILGTVMLVWATSWVVFAKPDWPHAGEWAYREAHLEILRREKADLPYISKDLIPPSRIILPSEEELGNFEIII